MTVAEASTPPSASQPAPAKAEAPASTGASSPPSKGAVAVGARAPDTYFYYDEPKITGWQDEDYHISPDALRHGRPAYGGGAGRRDGGRKAYDRPADEPGLNRYGSYGDDRAPPQQDSYYPGYEKEDSWREGDASYRHKEAPYHPHKPEGPSNYGNSWGSYGGPRQVQEPYVDEQPYAKHSYGECGVKLRSFNSTAASLSGTSCGLLTCHGSCRSPATVATACLQLFPWHVHLMMM